MFKKLRNPNEGSRYEKYSKIKQELQAQNAYLMQERQNLLGKTHEQSQVPSQYTIIEKNDEEEYDHEESNINNVYTGSNFNPEEPPSFQPDARYKSSRRSPKKSKNRQERSRNIVMSDDILQIIEDIQRKAFNQIENLRADKIKLLRKLNEQIKIHNSEKKKRIRLENRVSSLSNQQYKNTSKQNGQRRNPIPIVEQQQQNNSPPQQYAQHPKFGQKYNIHQKSNSNHGPKMRKANNPGNQGQYQPQYIPEQEQYELQDNYEQQQNENQHSGQSVIRRPENMNPNIPQSQSMYYVDKQKMQNVDSQNGIQNNINRPRQQNTQMRNTLSKSNSPNIAQVKNKLENQIRGLAAKANYYEQMIKQRVSNTSGLEASQIQSLFAQGNTIVEQGRRLMKVKSNPDFRSATQILNISSPYQNNDNSRFRGTRVEQEEAYNLMGQEIKRKSNNYSNNLTGEYQRFLESMNRVTYS